MNIKKLISINKERNNVFNVPLPYWWAINGGTGESDENHKKSVIFLGNDMRWYLPTMNKDEYVKRVNQCLDYIRRECGDCELIYKPHPADINESECLDLHDFRIVNDKTNAEIFFWENYYRIKYVFAVNSTATLSAHGLGINSYVFLDLFDSVYGKKVWKNAKDCFLKMPQSFFIKDLDSRLMENKIALKRDPIFEQNFRDLFKNSNGDLWLVVSASEFVITMVAIARLVRDISPSAKIHLVIWRHHRWDALDLDFTKKYFDEIIFLPRIYYSLKPEKLFGTLKTAIRVRRLGIKPEDIIVSGSQVEFLENCFMSYYKNNNRIGLLFSRDFYANYDLDNAVFSENNSFRFSKASLFYNKIWEPLLGLNKTLFLHFAKERDPYIVRYQKPVNEIFDQVYILN